MYRYMYTVYKHVHCILIFALCTGVVLVEFGGEADYAGRGRLERLDQGYTAEGESSYL